MLVLRPGHMLLFFSFFLDAHVLKNEPQNDRNEIAGEKKKTGCRYVCWGDGGRRGNK